MIPEAGPDGCRRMRMNRDQEPRGGYGGRADCWLRLLVLLQKKRGSFPAPLKPGRCAWAGVNHVTDSFRMPRELFAVTNAMSKSLNAQPQTRAHVIAFHPHGAIGVCLILV